MSNPIYAYDFTLRAEDVDRGELSESLSEIAKKWVFQLEQGEENDYKHYQGRVSLHKKMRFSALLKLWRSISHYDHMHWSITSTNGAKAKWTYVMKAQTRLDGPWSNEENDLKLDSSWDVEKYYPWQEKIIDMTAQKPNNRIVDCIIDETGNSGKTLLTMHLMCKYKRALRVPGTINDGDRLIQFVAQWEPKEVYTFDLPRAVPKRQLNGLYSAIEEVKNGYLYDTRYGKGKGAKLMTIAPPHIWVFTNTWPDLEKLSEDRWRFWKIVDKQLKRAYPEGDPNAPAQ